jgi:hypothetical protein
MGKEEHAESLGGEPVRALHSVSDARTAAAQVDWARRIQDVTVPQDPRKCAACGRPAKYRPVGVEHRDRLCAKCYRVLLHCAGLGLSQSYRRDWTLEAARRLGRWHHVHETGGCESCRLLARGHDQYGWLVTRCRECGHLLYGQSGHECVAHHAVVYRAFLEETRRA